MAMAVCMEEPMGEAGQRRRLPPKEKKLNTRIYNWLVDPMSLYQSQKIAIFYGIVVVFAIGWGTSTYFRCSTLLLLPNALGQEGGALLLVFVMASIYAGPVSNLEHNMEEALRSVGCIAELQINHTKLIWDAMTTPLKTIAGDLVKVSKELRRDSDNIKKLFKVTEDEMESTEGYNVEKERVLEEKVEEENKSLTTQQKFDFKTMLRCEYVIEKGVEKCHDWFHKKHEDCMSLIRLPILNTLLCLPMKFTFLCNILNVMNVWCKNNLPFGDNFGNLFDMVNATLMNMTSGFSIEKTVRTRNTFVGLDISEKLITEDIRENISRKRVLIEKAKSLLEIILSCAFIFLFITAYNYTNYYNTDFLWDNFYVTTYFMQIDARRRKHGKRHLLPLLKTEKADFVFPLKLALQGPELKVMVKEFSQCLPVVILLIMAIIFDRTLFNLLHIISKHSQVSYNFSSHHRLEIFVGGESIIARLLQKTISAFNTSSATLHLSSLTVCLPQPVTMDYMDYLWTCFPVVGLLLNCILHVYCYRLRRVVASFFFPQREKARVLFLYNTSLMNRGDYINTMRKRILKKFRDRHPVIIALMDLFPWLRVIIRRRCIVCDESESRSSYVCPTGPCGAVYCRQCWIVMGSVCYICKPRDHPIRYPTKDFN
ncbi:E3 ubiquitin-protein ligase DCST1 isoform X3 [Pseudophryne corroboree]|uniref:E3 ubiquitin-protein ligase DCST1 isoform X3 n=1 Tax=Pseudophryne corroboree TaxID=495146 RepID=UPI003081860D